MIAGVQIAPHYNILINFKLILTARYRDWFEFMESGKWVSASNATSGTNPSSQH